MSQAGGSAPADDFEGRSGRELERLAQAMVALSERLRRLEEHTFGSSDREGTQAQPLDFSDPRIWQALTDWLLSQAADHGVAGKLPECWYLHPAVVSQAVSLYAWYVDVFGHPRAKPTDALAWHQTFYQFADSVWPRYAGHDLHDDHGGGRTAKRDGARRERMLERVRDHAAHLSEGAGERST